MTDWSSAVARLEGAYSAYTLVGYAKDFRLFEAWCEKSGFAALPAAPLTVAEYVRSEGETKKPTTIRRRICAIRKIHRLCNFIDPTDDEEVGLALRRVRRAKPSRPRQAFGITAQYRDRLLSSCSNDLIGSRDKVLVSVGFDVLCRRGELVSLSAEDLTLEADGRFRVLVRRAKNDPEGAGRTARLSSATSSLLKDWIAAAAIDKGPLLRPVYKENALALYLAPLTVSRVLQKLAKRAGLETAAPQSISGHSLRVGAAQQLTLNGFCIPQLMRAGGWRSTNIVSRYIENVDLDVWG